jgi:hypothetical protein
MKPRERVAPLSESLAKWPIVTTLRTESEYGRLSPIDRAGKAPHALANISGAMMIQATVPTALGLFFTPWLFDSVLALAAMVTAAAVLGLMVFLRRNLLAPIRLTLFAIFYVIFAVGIVILRHEGRLT